MTKKVMRFLQRTSLEKNNILGYFLSNGKGQAMTEYGLLIALIAVVLIGVISLLTGKLQEAFQAIVDALSSGD